MPITTTPPLLLLYTILRGKYSRVRLGLLKYLNYSHYRYSLLCCYLYGISSMLSLLLFAAVASAKYIVPGARWRDTDGNLVNAHAGGVTIDKETGKFWWFGEYKIQGQEEGGGVSVYSSDDLATWEHHGFALGKLSNETPFSTRRLSVLDYQSLSKATRTSHQIV